MRSPCGPNGASPPRFARDEFEIGDCLGNPVGAVPEVILHVVAHGRVVASASHSGGFATTARVDDHGSITLDPTEGMPTDPASLQIVAALREAAAEGFTMPRLDLDFALPDLPAVEGAFDRDLLEDIGVEAWLPSGEPAWRPHLWPLPAEVV